VKPYPHSTQTNNNAITGHGSSRYSRSYTVPTAQPPRAQRASLAERRASGTRPSVRLVSATPPKAR
jgi:hypothetical protein